MGENSNSLIDFWTNHKLLTLFIIAFLVRFSFCFIKYPLNLDEVDYIWTMNGLCSTLHKVTLLDRYLIYLFYGQNPYIAFLSLPPLPMPRNSIMTFCPAKFYSFSLLLTPIYQIFGIFGVKTVLSLISSVGIITCYKFLETIVDDEKTRIIGSAIYSFNFFSIYYSFRIMPENFYFGISPLILYFFMKLAKEGEFNRKCIIYALFLGVLAICIDIRSSFAMPYILGLLMLLIYKSNWKNLIEKLILVGVFCILGVLPILYYSLITFNDPFKQILQPILVNSSIPVIPEIGAILTYVFLLMITFIFSLPYICRGLKKGFGEKNWLVIAMLGWAIFQHINYYTIPLYLPNAHRWSLATLIGYSLIAIIGFNENDNYYFLNKENYLKFYIICSIVVGSILVFLHPLP
ncbi:MAG: hypothetical protein ACTSRG_01640 [Candidatus Helarchaeota archaeon]